MPLSILTRAYSGRSRLSRAVAVVAMGLSAVAAAGEAAPVNVTGSRVTVADVMPECAPEACNMDLGAAPPAGSSSYIDAALIRSALVAAGEKAPANLQGVRVVSTAKVLSPLEAGELARPSIELALPDGVTLRGVEAKSKLTLPLLAVAGDASLPKLPKRAGPAVTTAMLDILLDGVVVRRVPLLVRVVIAASAARPDVPRGHAVTLIIERRTATISTSGVAMRDTEIGETAPFRVQRTGRVLNAIVKSAGLAQVLEVD
jgi:hypothetical protein